LQFLTFIPNANYEPAVVLALSMYSGIWQYPGLCGTRILLPLDFRHRLSRRPYLGNTEFPPAKIYLPTAAFALLEKQRPVHAEADW